LKYYRRIFLICIIWVNYSSWSQNTIADFLTPADSLNTKRLNTVIISEAMLASISLIALHQLWYSNYSTSDFHFINDNKEWLQMDKAGHVFSSYHLGKLSADALKWSGVSKRNQLIYGSTFGLVFLTSVEVFDGYSSNWGASLGDIVANVSGTSLYVSQELLWQEQRITPKFSFHTTSYSSMRPNVLGNSLGEQVLKDYNGQTYWLSCNLRSFAKNSKIPKWLNLAVGYGAEGMLAGEQESQSSLGFDAINRYRQFYFSADVDLTKIETKSPILKTLFTIFNSLKIPAPTLEIRGSQGVKFHLVYF
jgi:uncharacterized protein YfiM (DUF2279 family)